ncbi:MAG: hypothetical protein ABEI27_02165 [Halobellus sp.]
MTTPAAVVSDSQFPSKVDDGATVSADDEATVSTDDDRLTGSGSDGGQ